MEKAGQFLDKIIGGLSNVAARIGVIAMVGLITLCNSEVWL